MLHGSLHILADECKCFMVVSIWTPSSPGTYSRSLILRLFLFHARQEPFKMAEVSSEMPCGYDEDFVNPTDEDLQCAICYLALREPVLTRCGHRFCKECLERHMARYAVGNYHFVT